MQTPGANPSSPGSHSQSPDGIMRDQGPPLKIPRRTSEKSLQHSASSQSIPAAAASSGISLNDRQNGDVRQGAGAAFSNSSSSPVKNANSQHPAPDKNASSSSSSAAVPSAVNSNTMKRQRTSISSQPKVPYPTPSDDENEDSQQSAFFLKHQNRSLASELKALQYQLSLLESERSYRREQCRTASQALNSLQATWTQMETGLHQPKEPASSSVDVAPMIPQDAPMSTGTGAHVELVGALFDALASLATKSPTVPVKNEDDDGEEDGEVTAARGSVTTSAADIDQPEKQQLNDLSTISNNILQRANTLEGWIRSLLQRATAENGGGSSISSGNQDMAKAGATDQRVLVRDLGILRGQCQEYKMQIAELSKARSDTAKSERKVRRSIYRLSTGRVKIEQVMKDMEKSDEDGGLATEAKMEALSQDNAGNSSSSQMNANTTSQESHDEEVKQEAGVVNSQELLAMRKQMEDLEKQISNRDNSIQELQSKLSDREQRINLLSSKALSDDDAEKVQLQKQSQKRLEKVEQEMLELKEKLKETRDNWAKARGDADAALKSLDDLQTKHKKRWQELTGSSEESGTGDPIDIPLSIEATEQAQKIIELDHKLKQALENVRQADAVRTNLKEALVMNGVLQAKLDEIKGKYAALQASRSSNAKSSSEAAANQGSGSSSHPDKVKEVKPEKVEKMQREHRRMRKELAAVALSKEAAKSKLERAEKERDNLMETNARLLKQSAEKDDMNAKSLSTILHLKNLTEQLNMGKISLEQQLKSAGQVSLAARLATNAKDRVAEEVTKEKQTIEKKLENCEGRNEALKKELETTVGDWSEADAKISILNSQLTKSTKRSDEVVEDLEREQKSKRKLQDSLDLAMRQAGDATDKLNEFAKREGVNTGGPASLFTVEQLNTQVGVLKHRLACPVCQCREKDCIIMRCRHMFCKHCVDENVANRSRKCPSCGLKFSEKDVEDVWL